MIQTAGKHILGSVDGLQGGYLYGWAFLPDNPGTRLWVELIADDCPLTGCRAEYFHPGAHEHGHGDGCCGFWLEIPKAMQGTNCTLDVRVANTNYLLPRAGMLDQTPQEDGVLGEVVSDGGLRLAGWCKDISADAGQEIAPTTVKALHKGVVVATALADEPRVSPSQADGYGFTLSLPLELADGRPHSISVVDAQNKPISGSPVTINCLARGLHSLLKTKSDKNDARLELIGDLMKRYEAYFPKSLGFSRFEAWNTCFKEPVCSLKQNSCQVGVIVLPGPGIEKTVQSLGRQNVSAFRAASTVQLALPSKNLFKDVPKDWPGLLVEMARAFDYLLWLEPGCELDPHGLFHLVKGALGAKSDILYCDGVTTSTTQKTTPLLRPCFDPDLFWGMDYLGPALLVTSTLMQDLLASEMGNQDDPLQIRTSLVLYAAHHAKAIRHLPVPLCHQADFLDPDRINTRKEILGSWLSRLEPESTLEIIDSRQGLTRIHRPVVGDPLVSLIIPTRDQPSLLATCIHSLQEKTTYPHVEIIVVDNGSREPETHKLLDELAQDGVQVLSYPHLFNYSAINNFAVTRARGEIICLLNNDLELITPDWLEQMLPLLLRSDVGAVGAKLLWRTGLVQHGGVVVGVHQLAAHVGNHWLETEPGYMNRNLLTGRWSALTGACLLTRKKDFQDLGGLDEVLFPVTFNDVDYCLRLGERNKVSVWTPHARFFHEESASRGTDDSPVKKIRARREMAHLRDKWGDRLLDDPYYNPNLELSARVEVFDGLALPPRTRSIR